MNNVDPFFVTIVLYIVGLIAAGFCGGAAIVGCILAAALYAGGCLSCPQHDNNDIPMEVMQSDLESAGKDADLAEAI